MDRLRLGLVIPALNEGKTIASVVAAAKEYGVVIVVNDGSSDDTAVQAEGAGAVVVSHAVNQGYDAALNSGFKKAEELGVAYVLTLDADGQHDPSLIRRYVEALDAGADVALGVRHRKQRFGERLFAFVTRLLWNIEDPLCGMKAYRIEVYKALGHFDCYASVGSELMLFAVRRNYKLAHIPFNVHPRQDGAPRFGQTIRANIRILRGLLGAFTHRH